jgi:hypothetical protein
LCIRWDAKRVKEESRGRKYYWKGGLQVAYLQLPKKGVEIYDSSKAYNGYTLFSVMWCKDAWLIDMKGQVVHH